MHTKPQTIPLIGAQAIAPASVASCSLSLLGSTLQGRARAGGITFPTVKAPIRRAFGPVAALSVDGVLSQGDHLLAALLGGTGMIPLGESLRLAADDPNVRAIVLRINSPGGDLAGMCDLIADARYAKSKKPLHAIAHDGAEASALWLASVAGEIVATPTALVGSVGVVLPPLVDATAMLDRQGVRVFNATTGTLKGAGMLGVPVSPEIRASYQRLADKLAEPMIRDVAAGRKTTPDKIKAMQGGTFSAPDAKARGLVDRIVPSLFAYVAELQAKYRDQASARPAEKTEAPRGGTPARIVSPAATLAPKPEPDPVEGAIREAMKANGGNRTLAMGQVFTRDRTLWERWKRQQVDARVGRGQRHSAPPPPPG